MAINEFMTFAGDPAANVMTQTEYAATGFTPRLLGFSTGTAMSIQLNKVWRQSSLMTSMLGQFTVDNTGLDMIDDGTPAGMNTLETHFTAAITTVARAAVGVGYLPLVGGTLTGPLIINSPANQISINASLAQPAQIIMARDAAQNALLQANSATVPRWQLFLATAEQETGNNAGSNLAVNRFADNGTYLGTPFTINRASGIVDFAHMPTLGGGSFPYLPLAGGTISGPLNISYPGLGISYPQGNRNYFAFSWDGNLHSWVDNTYIGAIAMQGWVSSVVGNYLPIWGGTITGNLQVNGSLVVNGGSGFRSSVWFANMGDFVNFSDGRFRFRQWAGNWYDAWDGSNGQRVWSAPGAWIMSLDGAGNLHTNGSIHSDGARIMSIGPGNSPSFTCWDTAGGWAGGMWVAAGALRFGGMNGNGDPTVEWMRITGDGFLNVWNGMAVGGSFRVGSNMDVVGSQSVQGAWWNAGRMDSYGSRFVVHGGQPSIAMDQNGFAMGMFLGAFLNAGIVFGLTDGWGNPANMSAFSNYNGTFAAGGFYSWSGEEQKENVRPASGFDSLKAIANSTTFSYDREGVHTEFGFTAESIKTVLPDVIYEQADLPAINIVSLIAHAYRAIKQLNDKVERLAA